MSRFQKLFIFGWAFFLSLPCHGQFLAAGIDSSAQVRHPDFLQDFPFPDYLQFLSEASLAHFVEDIDFIALHKGPVDEFLDSLYALQQAYLQDHPNDYDYMLRQLRMGETLLQLDGIKKGFIFPAFGDLMLQSLATQLDHGLANQQYQPSNGDVQYLIRRLRENKFFVNVPVSDWQKGFDHLKSGNWGYLFRKVRLKQPILFYCGISIFVLIAGAVVLIILRKKIQIQRKPIN
jgi:hypothetical protein